MFHYSSLTDRDPAERYRECSLPSVHTVGSSLSSQSLRLELRKANNFALLRYEAIQNTLRKLCKEILQLEEVLLGAGAEGGGGAAVGAQVEDGIRRRIQEQAAEIVLLDQFLRDNKKCLGALVGKFFSNTKIESTSMDDSSRRSTTMTKEAKQTPSCSSSNTSSEDEDESGVNTRRTSSLQDVVKSDSAFPPHLNESDVDRTTTRRINDLPLDELLILLSLTWQLLRGGSARGEQWRGGLKFVRKTQKYWVPKSEVVRLKAGILEHLPYLIFGKTAEELGKILLQPFREPVETGLPSDNQSQPPPHLSDSQQISSVYLDNPEHAVCFRRRVYREEGARLVRCRWYETTEFAKSQEIFVERKIHHECWVAESSTKERFTLPRERLRGFLKSEFDVDQYVQNLRFFGSSRGKKQPLKEEQLEDFHDLASEVSTMIKKDELRPMIRTAYKRCAFQSAASNELRISLDTEMKLRNEYRPEQVEKEEEGLEDYCELLRPSFSRSTSRLSSTSSPTTKLAGSSSNASGAGTGSGGGGTTVPGRPTFSSYSAKKADQNNSSINPFNSASTKNFFGNHQGQQQQQQQKVHILEKQEHQQDEDYIFPFAILEVKLAGLEENPPWVAQLLRDCRITQVYKFSKFQHAMALLHPEVCVSKPHWWRAKMFGGGGFAGGGQQLQLQDQAAREHITSGYKSPPPSPSSSMIELPTSMVKNLNKNVNNYSCSSSPIPDSTSSLKMRNMGVLDFKAFFANERTLIHYVKHGLLFLFFLRYIAHAQSDFWRGIAFCCAPVVSTYFVWSLLIFQDRVDILQSLQAVNNKNYRMDSLDGPCLAFAASLFLLIATLMLVMLTSPTMVTGGEYGEDDFPVGSGITS
ncbi:unnamed protein product [Amoebophrya sp. A25]|nr:unnamed protein product [Amoebophrya sp. A25]|eukprot:GSA25T00023271001.1